MVYPELRVSSDGAGKIEGVRHDELHSDSALTRSSNNNGSLQRKPSRSRPMTPATYRVEGAVSGRASAESASSLELNARCTRRWPSCSAADAVQLA